MGSQSERRRRLDRLQRLADQLDSRFSLFGFRVGWDAILGLIPGIGGIATALPAGAMIVEGSRIGARKRVLSRMALNGAIDFGIGTVPLLGDALDAVFKCHQRNVALLRREIEHLETQEMEDAMTKRHRSKDGSKETDDILGAESSVSQGGRNGGALQRDIASKDELKRAYERPAGTTRVTKSKELKDA